MQYNYFERLCIAGYGNGLRFDETADFIQVLFNGAPRIDGVLVHPDAKRQWFIHFDLIGHS